MMNAWAYHRKNFPFEACLGFGLSVVVMVYSFSPFRIGSAFIFGYQEGWMSVAIALSTIGSACILTKRILISRLSCASAGSARPVSKYLHRLSSFSIIVSYRW